ncbi:MAG: hypothetical protein L0Z51_09780 [Candidatus Latescibacteria bacterium]|nr:hypothetical protein [Candidatus Latescibacterota bacterium]
MSHTCREDMSGFDQLLKLPPGHPNRKVVEDCPRCGARFLAYRKFMLADDLSGADTKAAQRHLSAFIEAEAARSLPQPNVSKQTAPRARFAFPQLRWVVPVAAVLVAVAIGVWRMQPGADRAPEVRAVEDAASIELLQVQLMNGVVDLTWEPVPTAEEYAVRLLDQSFAEIRRAGPVATTTLRVDLDPAEGVRYCQVVALVSGDEIAVSPIRRLPATESR